MMNFSVPTMGPGLSEGIGDAIFGAACFLIERPDSLRRARRRFRVCRRIHSISVNVCTNISMGGGKIGGYRSRAIPRRPGMDSDVGAASSDKILSSFPISQASTVDSSFASLLHHDRGTGCPAGQQRAQRDWATE